MSNILKNGITIGKAKVISNEVNKPGASLPNRKLLSTSHITIHNTGLVDVKANNFHRSLKRENSTKGGRQASWHFTVDDIEIYQEVDMSMEAWHAGSSNGNKNSIGIEITMWSNKEKQRLSYDNAAQLVAMIMKEKNIPLSKVVQHNNWSGKDCPAYLRSGKHGYNWNWFIALVKKYSEGGVSTETAPSPSTTPKPCSLVVRVTADSLNVRKTPSASGTLVTSIKKGEVYTIVEQQDGWGKLKSGAGWISLKYVEIIKEDPYVVKVEADILNVRDGAGTDYKVNTTVKKGDSYTVVETEEDWGKLKSGAGWINLDHTKKM